MTEELKRKIGAMFMVNMPGQEEFPEFLEFCKKYRVGAFCVNAKNAISVERICYVTKTLRDVTFETTGEYPLIFMDQEGGWVTRFYCGSGSIPGAMAYAATGADGEKMYNVGNRLGKLLRALGVNGNDAPILDVNINPKNPIIGTRAYGDKLEKVKELGIGFARGMIDTGVMGVAKHFPGHGNVSSDTHTDTVINDSPAEVLKETEFSAFRDSFQQGVGAVMTAHVTYPAISKMPATLSHEIMTDYARGELGFDGIIVTDSMGMNAISGAYPKGESAVLAIEAGCDVLLYYSMKRKDTIIEAFNAVYEAVESGRISEERIEESYQRIARQKERFNVAEAEPDLELANKLVYDEKAIADIAEDSLGVVTCMKNDGVLEGLDQKKILCIAPISQALRGVEEAMKVPLSFADEFATVFPQTEKLSALPKQITPALLAEAKQDYDVAVVGLFETAANPAQLEVLEELKKNGKPVIAILLRSPYDYSIAKDCNAVITAYEYTSLSCKSIIESMKTGVYRGTLPVTIEGLN
ncbi:MAG: hypothetical protein IKD18_01920 [Clostridia bacterium]|nr:hypothetical protein [Clostridia bacterium]